MKSFGIIVVAFKLVLICFIEPRDRQENFNDVSVQLARPGLAISEKMKSAGEGYESVVVVSTKTVKASLGGRELLRLK